MSNSSSLLASFAITQTFNWPNVSLFFFQIPYKDEILVNVALRVMYTPALQWTFPIVLVLLIVPKLLILTISSWVSSLKCPHQKLLYFFPVNCSRKLYVLYQDWRLDKTLPYIHFYTRKDLSRKNRSNSVTARTIHAIIKNGMRGL